MTVSPAYLQELHRLMDRPTRYRFGHFELTTVPSRLTRDGHDIVLQPQPARALELLLRHRGHIVTREMLREHLWGSGTYLDHEQGINFALRKIRIALADSPSVPRYVETVPRVGYRFVAAVEELPVASELENAAKPVATTTRRRAGARPLWGRAVRPTSAAVHGCRSRRGGLLGTALEVAQVVPGA